jgi:hypothetical protein
METLGGVVSQHSTCADVPQSAFSMACSGFFSPRRIPITTFPSYARSEPTLSLPTDSSSPTSNHQFQALYLTVARF